MIEPTMHLRFAPMDGNDAFVAETADGRSVLVGDPAVVPGALKPSELLLAALAGCSGLVATNVLTRRRSPATTYRLDARAVYDAEAHRLDDLRLVHHVPADAAAGMEKVVQIAERHCTIAQTLLGGTPIAEDVRALPEEPCR